MLTIEPSLPPDMNGDNINITVKELIAKLQQVDQEWTVSVNGSIHIAPEDHTRYGYVFTDERQTKLLTRRN